MPPDNFSWLLVPLEIVLVDLLVGGDNAFVIALACQRLPQQYFRRAIVGGTLAAIFVRLVLTMLASELIEIPCLKLAAALVLMSIALKLLRLRPGEPERQDERIENSDNSGIWSSIALVLLADAIMGFDNIVALAAIARGNVVYLALGLAVSVPVLVYGGVLLAKLLNEFTLLVIVGGAVLGWVAGDLAIGDAVLAPWVAAQAPALPIVVPLLGAAFVLVEGLASARARKPDENSAEDDRKLAGIAPVEPVPAIGRDLRASLTTLVFGSPVPATGCEEPPQLLETSVAKARGREENFVLIGFLAMFVLAGLMIAFTMTFGGGVLATGG